MKPTTNIEVDTDTGTTANRADSASPDLPDTEEPVVEPRQRDRDFGTPIEKTSIPHSLYTLDETKMVPSVVSPATNSENKRAEQEKLLESAAALQISEEALKKKQQDDLLDSVVSFGEENIDNEVIDLCLLLHECVQMRKKYMFYDSNTDPKDISLYPWEMPGYQHASVVEQKSDHYYKHHQPPCPFDPFDTSIPDDSPLRTNEHIEMQKGIMHVYSGNTELFPPLVSFNDYYNDYKRISRIIYHAPTKSFCYNRLKALELKAALYKNINEANEIREQKNVPHRDFYNVRKVDTHIHLASSMTQKRLLKFIKKKLKEAPNEVVIFRDGKKLTLSEVFESLNLTSYHISVDTLDVHANNSVLHRFDKFNLKYNPFGQSRLREIFLKTDNLINGRYFAELCKETFQDLADSRYQMSEPRVSIYGAKPDEWDKLADWINSNRMYTDHVRWLIQIPRIYDIHHRSGGVKNVQEMLDNIFRPLFEVTRDPRTHPKLHAFLKQVVAFDSVDDETKPEPRFHSRLPTPETWNTQDSPPYAYYNYYFYANITVLNQYRQRKGMNTFKFRPHCGEAGDVHHLISSYLLADNIAHGIELRKSPVLQYLYYLAQIGLAVSPLSNNSLFLDYTRNPFPSFFERGLNVSLSTDDPLMFHLCRDPLLEEYSISAQVWRLSNTDLCEIARNSVLQSGWDRVYKSYWLGENYYLPGALGNDITKTNVPNIRIQYRQETLVDEHLFILKCVMLNDLSCVKNNEKVLCPSDLAYSELVRLIKRSKPLFLKSAESLSRLDNILKTPSSEEGYTVITRESQKPQYLSARSEARTEQNANDWISYAKLALPFIALTSILLFNSRSSSS